MGMSLGKYQQGRRPLAWSERREGAVDRDSAVGSRIRRRRLRIELGVVARPAAALAVEVATGGDGAEPAGEAALAPPLAKPAPCGQQGVLRDVVAVVGGQSPGVSAKPRFMGAHQYAESGEVAPRRPAYQFGFLPRCQGST